MDIQKLCKECNNVYSTNGGRSCYCSSLCRGIAMRRMKNAESKRLNENRKNHIVSILKVIDCKFCNVSFTQSYSTQKFCSIDCRGDYAVQNMRNIRAQKKLAQ